MSVMCVKSTSSQCTPSMVTAEVTDKTPEEDDAPDLVRPGARVPVETQIPSPYQAMSAPWDGQMVSGTRSIELHSTLHQKTNLQCMNSPVNGEVRFCRSSKNYFKSCCIKKQFFDAGILLSIWLHNDKNNFW